MGDVTVSVVTTAYNHEKYIRQTIEGIVSQKTDFKFELLINDDCSGDGTADIIREYEAKYPDIIKPIYQSENQYSKGVNVARMLVMRATGEYVAFCEGDDYWCDEDKLQLQVDVLKAHSEYAACVHQTTELNCLTGAERRMAYRDGDGVISFTDVIQGGNRAFQMSSLLVRRELMLDPQLDELSGVSRIGDYPLSIFLALHGGIYYMNRAMSVYRCFSSGDSWTLTIKQHPELAVKHNEEMVKLLELTDKITDHKYADIIEDRITAHRYDSLMNQNSKAIFKDKRYAKFFAAESTYMKCLLIAKAYCPAGLWKLVKGLKK
jgi:glycosyltransferase involved in cell wall biosynthesis